jgi:hypothetical protein
MAMTADEVYVALEELQNATAYENRLQRRIDGIWEKLDEPDGPDR